jgi:hypothetical protein
VGLDDIDRAGRGDGEERFDGAAEPESRELTVRGELAGAREPGIDEHVETFEQAALGVRVEVGCASIGDRAIAACLHLGDALAAVSSAPALGVVVDVAHDRGEVVPGGAGLRRPSPEDRRLARRSPRLIPRHQLSADRAGVLTSQ